MSAGCFLQVRYRKKCSSPCSCPWFYFIVGLNCGDPSSWKTGMLPMPSCHCKIGSSFFCDILLLFGWQEDWPLISHCSMDTYSLTWAVLKLFRFSQISINFHHSTKFFKVFSNFTSSNKFINLTKLECGLVTGERECDWMLNVFILFCCLRHQHWHRTVLC